MMTESYSERRSRTEAEADGYRRRGSKLARKLLALQIGHMDAQGPKAQAVAIARFEGACAALSAEHGYTDHAWQMAVIGPWQAAYRSGNPRPAMTHAPGGNLEYLRWEAELAEAIDAELAVLR